MVPHGADWLSECYINCLNDHASFLLVSTDSQQQRQAMFRPQRQERGDTLVQCAA